MIRSVQYNILNSNKGKLSFVNKLMIDYKELLQLYISKIKDGSLPLKQNLNSTLLPQSDKINHSAWKQVAYKQASEILRSNYAKKKNQVFKRYQYLYARCIKKNKFKNFTSKTFKELNINIIKRIKVDLKNISINLDNRLFDIQTIDYKCFNEYIRITTPYQKPNFKKRFFKICIPIKHHKQHFKYQDWNRKNTIQLKSDSVKMIYEGENVEKQEVVEQLGIDIGYKKLISCSNGKFYGNHLFDIYKRLANKKRGSKAYERLLIHKSNETKRVANEFVKENKFQNLVIEDLKQVKYKSKLSHKTNNSLQYWSYRTLIDKLDMLSETEGFCITKVNPAYTSQMCSKCGVTAKSNRFGERYCCKSCGLDIDADYNASINILRLGVYES